ncbi:MAG: polysaccharide biosynthesis tyrosine autokinase [Nevskia sp.]|nr:polysaccharide biosynthesis tyrosine autokinase [Nevskia sp.]
MNLPTPLSTPPSFSTALAEPFQPIGIQVSDEQKLELLEYWFSIKKRKWAILGFAAACAVVAGAISFAVTPVYQGVSTVQIEPGQSKLVSFEDVYGGAIQAKEHYQTQIEILKSREVAERTAKALKLWDNPEYAPDEHADGLVAKLKTMMGLGALQPPTEDDYLRGATKQLQDNISIEPVRLSQLVKVNVESTDPALAAKLANALAENYILNDRLAKFQVSQQASKFLQEQLGDLGEKLRESEQALQTYRQSKGIVSLGGSAQTLAGQQVGGTNEQLVAAQARRLQLETVYQQVARASKEQYGGISWIMRDTSVLGAQARVTELTQKLAQQSQTLGARNNLVLQTQAELQAAQSSLRSLQAAVVDSLTREYQAALATEKSLERALSSARSGVAEVNKEEFQLAVLEREVQTNRELYDMFMSRAKETNLAGEVQAAIARIVDPAVRPEAPIKPKKRQLILVALVLALFAGAVVSVLLDKLDNTLKSGEDAEARLRLPLLTALPAIDEHNHEQMARLFIEEPNSQHAEAIRTARTGVLLSSLDQAHKCILVTSSIPGEGKTTLAINLALAHAQTKRTLLLDADMRRPQIGRRLGLNANAKGLSNLVSGQSTLAECLHTVADSPLLVMPVGDLPPNPLELILSDQFKIELALLMQQFEIVMIDSPPVELVSEALVLAPLATSTILVAKAMSTPTPLVRKSIARLQRAGANMLGVVLNQLDLTKASTYHGQHYGAADYGYNYGADAYRGAGYSSAEARSISSRS